MPDEPGKMGEFDLIRRINERLPRSEKQVNSLFETDAELVEWGDSLLAFTMDEFSEEEEYIGTHDPFLLGWNIAVGVLSDLLAVGAVPQFYSHACILSDLFSGEYLDHFFEGVACALEESKAFFIGGDMGTSSVWRYVGAAIGRVEVDRVRKRTGIESGDYLYVTGTLGDGNRAALLNYLAITGSAPALSEEYRTTRFELRLGESDHIGLYSTVCMDTSDGLVRTLETLNYLNPCALVIDPARMPYDRISAAVTRQLDIPSEALLFGSAGEYELFFTIPAYAEAAFLEETRYEFSKIGRAVPGNGVYCIRPGHDLESLDEGEPDVLLADESFCVSLEDLNPDPRKMESTKKYLEELLNVVKTLFGA